jgi:hypothetical protein
MIYEQAEIFAANAIRSELIALLFTTINTLTVEIIRHDFGGFWGESKIHFQFN